MGHSGKRHYAPTREQRKRMAEHARLDAEAEGRPRVTVTRDVTPIAPGASVFTVARRAGLAVPDKPYVRRLPAAYGAFAFTPGGLLHFGRGVSSRLAMLVSSAHESVRGTARLDALCGRNGSPALVMLYIADGSRAVPACRDCLGELPAAVVGAMDACSLPCRTDYPDAD